MKVKDAMQRTVSTVDAVAPAAQALSLMLAQQHRHLPVLEKGRLVGIVTERDLLGAFSDQEGIWGDSGNQVRDVMTAPAEQASPEEPLADAAARMNVKRLGCLPVVSAGSVVGILTRTDLLASLAQMPATPPPGADSVVADFMSRSVAAVHADTPVADAAATMVLLGIRHLPVIDAMERVIGMLSDRDVRSGVGDLKKVLEETGAPELHVEHVMAPEPRTIAPDASLSEAVGAFLDDRFGALPVVEEGDRLVGVISYVDVLAALAGRPRRT